MTKRVILYGISDQDAKEIQFNIDKGKRHFLSWLGR